MIFLYMPFKSRCYLQVKGQRSAEMHVPHGSARPGFEGGRRSRNCTNETDAPRAILLIRSSPDSLHAG